MSCRPQALGAYLPTSAVTRAESSTAGTFGIQSKAASPARTSRLSARLADWPKSAATSPYDIAAALPERQAHSHWASVGSENRLPVLADSHWQNSRALVPRTR